MPSLDPVISVRRLTETLVITDLASAFAEVVAPLGMSASASGMVSGPRSLSPAPFHFMNWPVDWLELYAAKGYIVIDPIPRWAIVSGEPVSWTDVVERLPRQDPGRDVQCAAQAHGFHEGFVTPVRTGGGALGLVSVGGDRRPAFTLQERLFLQTVSSAALMHAESLSGEIRSAASALTLREQECVALVRQGLTDAEIGRVLGVAITTVRSHLQNARVKVGARNRMELAMRQPEPVASD